MRTNRNRTGGPESLESILEAMEPTHVPLDARNRMRDRVLAEVQGAPFVRLARAKMVFMRSAAAFTTTATLLASTGLAAAGTMPGSPLYPVKRAMEEVRIAFAPEAFRPEALLEMTQERAREVRRLMDEEAPANNIEQATQGFGEAAGRAVDSQPDAAGAADMIEEIEGVVAEEPEPVQEQVGTLVPVVPEPEPVPEPDPTSGKTPAPTPEPDPSDGPSQGSDSQASPSDDAAGTSNSGH